MLMTKDFLSASRALLRTCFVVVVALFKNGSSESVKNGANGFVMEHTLQKFKLNLDRYTCLVSRIDHNWNYLTDWPHVET